LREKRGVILGRPSRPIISKEAAAQAALEIIDEEGIEGLSLERVANRLGARAPSLYYHLRNKAELLVEVTKLILGEGEREVKESHADWREAVVAISLATRRSILRHPRAAILMLRFYPRHLMLQSYEHWLQIYAVPPEQKMLLTEGLERLTFGSAIFSAHHREQKMPRIPAFDTAQFPHLAQAIEASPYDEEDEFAEIVRRFLSAF
jgi:TetR/AcrR family transcriptional regulator, tetracycline repressor protein